MFKSLVIIIGWLAAISLAVSCLESNPMLKLDKYLLANANSFKPESNIKLAENYRAQEATTVHKFKSNKKLLELLDVFISLRRLMNEHGKQFCTQDGYEIIKTFNKASRSILHSFEHITEVVDAILVKHIANCFSEYHSLLYDRIKPFMETRSAIFAISKPLLGKEAENLEKDLNIVDGKARRLLNTESIKRVYRHCESKYPETQIKDILRACIMTPCKQYMEQTKDVFDMARQVRLNKNGRYLEDKVPSEFEDFLSHWAHFEMCKAFVDRGVSRMSENLVYYSPGGSLD